MDRGPIQPQRPVQRAVNRQIEPIYQQQEGPQPVREKPNTMHQTTTHHQTPNETKLFKRFLFPIFIILIVIILALAGGFVWSTFAKKSGAAIDSNKYQAVFFTNGQVYFGKLHPLNKEYMKLTDIYYLQTQAAEKTEKTDPKNPQATSSGQSKVQLIKLGDEIHGPEDEMVISKDQLLFYENLKTDGQVAKSIANYKKK